VLQSWEWGQIKQQTGWHATRRVLRSERGGQAALQFLDRQLHPRLSLRVGYVPKGPVLNWQDHDLMRAALDEVQRLARARRCIFVKIDPDVVEDSDAGIRLRNELRGRGWRFSAEQIQFKNSAVTDLRSGEEALLEAMKSKWRYNIRLAARRGIAVRCGTEADLAGFYALYQTTGERDGFLIRPFDYYRTTWETYLRAQADPTNPAGGALLLAEHADEPTPVAGIFLLRYGERAWYFYGASSEQRRRDMPNYLLQWEGMRWAIGQGCTVYDWWGAPSNLNDPGDRLQGVWQFKQGFGACFEPHVGAWDYPVYPWLYRAYREVMPRVLDFLRQRRGQAAPSTAEG
jgi:lipid II:glycine glycyltransferase (peptidoglycan interpeptide bridge formation enzyme)